MKNNMKTLDLIGNEINVGDTVVSYNNLYKVLKIINKSYVRIILLNPSDTTRALNRYHRYMVVISSLIKE